MKFFRSLTLVVCLLFPCALFAQSTSAALTGSVDDPAKAVLPNVRITAINTLTGVKTVTKTNGDGQYVLPGLIPGPYRVEVDKRGFKSIIEAGLTLHTQDAVQMNFHMAVGSMSETVTVNANGVNINTTDASVSTVIDRDFVENMPLNGRSLQDLMVLVPGVALVGNAGSGGNSSPGNGGEITVNGQRTEANAFSVDGVNSNVGAPPGTIGGTYGNAGFAGATPAETALGTTQSMVSVDALQEFRATTSTYSAEYGRTPGGQFSFTTRSGTNDWHGSVFDYFRNEALDANNWLNNAENPQVPREKERQNDFGGTVGGPIRIPHLYNGKDKSFFSFSYEGLRLWTPQGLYTRSVPDQALRQQAPAALQPVLNAFPVANKGEDGLNDGLGIFQIGQSYPSSIDSISARLDHNFNQKFKIFGRYASTPSVASVYSGSVKNNTTINNRMATFGATNLVTSTQANELRFNITQVNSISNATSTNLGGATPFDLTTLPGPNGANLPLNGSNLDFSLAFGGRASLGLGQTENSQRQYNLTDAYSWTLGRHSLKFGVDWRRLSTFSTPQLAVEYVQFTSEAAVLANNVGSSGVILNFNRSPSPVQPLFKNFSSFGQDEWKVTPRLSLSLGLRWDVNPAPTNLTGPSPYTLNQIADLSTAQLAPTGTRLWKTDWHAFAPRVGGAYQLRQTPGHETVLRAGAGVFYDLGNLVGAFGYGQIGYSSSASFINVAFPLSNTQMVLPPPGITPPYDATVSAFDPNLKLPYTLQWNVALEQALGKRQALTVTYLGSAGRRLLETYFVAPDGNPNFGPGGGDGALITKNGPRSDYDTLQVLFQRTLAHGLQALASYTYSHSIDDASSNFDLSDLLERGSSDFDIRHNFQVALTYDVPGQYSNATLSELLRHWALDTRVTARSALPVDVIGSESYQHSVEAAAGASVNFHPNLVPGQPLYLYGSQYPGGKIINYDAFDVPTSGPGFDSEGDTPRNYARGFGAWQINVAVRREFPIHERLRLQFRAEAFNLLNHASFSGVQNNWTFGPYVPNCFGCGFGGAGGTLNTQIGGLNSLYQTGGPRSLQLALKLLF
ncbi:MAG TPA: TonB-dependent receptor [Acidobacteriaceae bacterium]|jgi:hypothetical protein